MSPTRIITGLCVCVYVCVCVCVCGRCVFWEGGRITFFSKRQKASGNSILH